MESKFVIRPTTGITFGILISFLKKQKKAKNQQNSSDRMLKQNETIKEC